MNPFTFFQNIGYKYPRFSVFVIALTIISLTALRASAFKPQPTAQQQAALDIPVREKIAEDTQAQWKLHNDNAVILQNELNCVADNTQCPLGSGTTLAH